MEQQSKADGAGLSWSHVLSSLTLGALMAALLTEILLAEDFLAERNLLSLLQDLTGGGGHKRVVLPVLGLLLALLCYVLVKPTPEVRAVISEPSASVGSGSRETTVEEIKLGGSGSASVNQGKEVRNEIVFAKYVVNAAGNYSDKIANMIGDTSFAITPRLGNYLLLHRNQGHFARLTLFPCPGPLGKGRRGQEGRIAYTNSLFTCRRVGANHIMGKSHSGPYCSGCALA